MAQGLPRVAIHGSTIHLNIYSVAEAKLAIKELKIKKKEVALAKKEVVLRQQAIRADYTDNSRRKGSMMQGGGKFGRLVRGVQRASRDADKQKLANQLRPLEEQKAHWDAMLSALDSAILKVEAYLVENT